MGTRRRWVAFAVVLWTGVFGAYLGYRAGRPSTREEHPGPTDPLSGAPAVDADGTLVGRLALRLDKDTWEEGEEITGKVWFEVDWSEKVTDRSRPLALPYPILHVELDRACFAPTVEFDVTLQQTMWVRHRYEVSFRVRAEPTLRELAVADGKGIVAVPAGAHSVRATLYTNDPHRPSHSAPLPGFLPKDSTLGLYTHWCPFRVVEGDFTQPSQEDVLSWLAKANDATWPKIIEYYKRRQFPLSMLTRSVAGMFSTTPEVLVVQEGPGAPYYWNSPHIPFRVILSPGQEFTVRNDGKVMHNAHLICETDVTFNTSIQPGALTEKLRTPRVEGLYEIRCDVHRGTPLGWILVVK